MEFAPAWAKGKGTAVNKELDCQWGMNGFQPFVWL